MPDEDEINDFPEITPYIKPEEETPGPVHATPLHELSKQQRIDRQIALIDQYHAHIAKGLRLMWGYKECMEYMDKLVISGGDGVGKTRVGFHVEVLSALLDLISLHEITHQ